jgi:hypothetical protein
VAVNPLSPVGRQADVATTLAIAPERA